MTGRPTLYTPQNAARILAELARGRALRAVCRDDGMPAYGAVRQWIADDRQGFGTRYRQARHIDKAGHPGRYSPAIAERIVQELINDRPLDAICRDPGMPGASTVRQWVKDDRAGFAARYRHARRIGRARPGPATAYSAEIADIILMEMADGQPLTHVCRDPLMPSRVTVRHWARRNHDGFAARFRVAHWLCLDAMADEIIHIVDNPRKEWITRRAPGGGSETVLVLERISRTKSRSVALRWLMSKVRRRGLWWDLEAAENGDDTLARVMKEIEERNRRLLEPADRDVAEQPATSPGNFYPRAVIIREAAVCCQGEES